MAANHKQRLTPVDATGPVETTGSSESAETLSQTEPETAERTTLPAAPRRENGETDKYAHYAALYDPDWAAGWDEEGPVPARFRAPKKEHTEIVHELTDEAAGLEAGFRTTYTPARYEGPFLLDAIRYFYDDRPDRGCAGQCQGRQGGQRLPLPARAYAGRRIPGRQGLPAAPLPKSKQRQDVSRRT